MKILHTADWHIGKKLYRYDLYEDFNRFIKWLSQLIKEQNIDVVMVSGDIFDTANPSAEARKQFYETLLTLNKLQCRLIITAGNHDSPLVLNAPKELLQKLNIHLIGSLPKDLLECLIPIYNDSGEAELVIAAIPFLRDSELRKSSDGILYEDKLKAIQEGIERIFVEVSTLCKLKYPNLPIIAMGHLFASGNIATSESERDIQIGNQALFEAQKLQQNYDYVALGHIHKPQRINAEIPILYSGSPIALSFSEKDDQKRVLLIDTEKGFEPESVLVPQFRKLIAIKGTLLEIQQKLSKISCENELINLLEITLVEPKYTAQIEDEFKQWVNSFSLDNYEIVKDKMEFEDRNLGASELFDTSQRLEDLKPQEVFEKLLQSHSYDEVTERELLVAFSELLEEIQQ